MLARPLALLDQQIVSLVAFGEAQFRFIKHIGEHIIAQDFLGVATVAGYQGFAKVGQRRRPLVSAMPDDVILPFARRPRELHPRGCRS